MLEPINFDVQLQYQCPGCNAGHWLTKEEAKAAGFKIVCDVCGTIHQIRTVDNTKLLVNFFKTKVKVTATATVTNIVDDAYTILKKYGYKQADIATAQQSIRATSAKQLVKKFLAIR
tara:strand:+ start:14727 stop:15077 length:351 start_codon:yes stop_codon:yes gene_type:complete